MNNMKYSENNTAKYYDKIYKKWIKKDYTEYECNLIEKYLPKNGKLLDVGCGSGRHAKYFYDKGYKVVGVEPVEYFVNKLKSEKPSLKIFKGYFNNFKKKEKFDVIISMWNTFHQLAMNEKEALFIIKKIKSLLKRNGVIIFSLSPGEKFKIKDYNFSHEENIDGKKYCLDWKIINSDKDTLTVTSLEHIKVYNEEDELIDDVKAHIKQRYWKERDLIKFAKKLSLKLKIIPPFPNTHNSHYIFIKEKSKQK